MKFISRTTMATIFTDEIESAVPRNNDTTSRNSGCGSMPSGRYWPRAESAAERKDDAGHRNARRRAADAPHKARVGLHAREQEKHQDPELRHSIEHGFLRRTGRKEGVLPIRGERAEHGRSEQEAAEQLTHDRGLADALHQFAQQAADQDHDGQGKEEDQLGWLAGLVRCQRACAGKPKRCRDRHPNHRSRLMRPILDPGPNARDQRFAAGRRGKLPTADIGRLGPLGQFRRAPACDR